MAEVKHLNLIRQDVAVWNKWRSNNRQERVDLSESDLSNANLRGANLSRADITGCILYGTARNDWIIDSIKCDYFFSDSYGGKRVPKDRNFKPDEFECKMRERQTQILRGVKR